MLKLCVWLHFYITIVSNGISFIVTSLFFIVARLSVFLIVTLSLLNNISFGKKTMNQA